MHGGSWGSSVLARNGYNLTAVKILLKWGYDPSVHNSYALSEAAGYGSPEVLQLLIDDPRIDPRKQEGALLNAAASGRVDNMRVLLANERTREVIEKESIWERRSRLQLRTTRSKQLSSC